MKKFKNYFFPFFGITIFYLSLRLLFHELHGIKYSDIIKGITNISLLKFSVSILFVGLSYFCIIAFEWMGFKYIKNPLQLSKIAFTAVVSSAFTNLLGNITLSGVLIRYRFYSTWDVSNIDITKCIAFITATLWLGFLAVCGILFTFYPSAFPVELHIDWLPSTQPIGLLFIFILFCVFVIGLTRKNAFMYKAWEFEIPGFRLIFMQTVISSLEWVCSATTLYFLLPQSVHISFPFVLSVFFIAIVAGTISTVPGGLGVFEVVIISFLSPYASKTEILLSLLIYRIVFYFLPFLVAVILVGRETLNEKAAHVKKIANRFGNIAYTAAPNILAGMVFVAGCILLLSGATPAEGSRLAWLKKFMPLPVLEISHFLGSIIGVLLLFLARGLNRRLDAAYVITILLLGMGAISSLLKGFDYEEAIILSIMFIILLPTRSYFYRKSSLFAEKFTLNWLLSIGAVLICTTWVMFFIYKHVEYSNDLWWTISFSSNASRSVRAMAGIIAVIGFIGVAKLFNTSSVKFVKSSEIDLKKIHDIILNSQNTMAYYSLIGDKSFIFSDNKRAFIMYGVRDDNLIALGSPIGPKEEWKELLWKFRALADQYGGWVAFTEIPAEDVHHYLDLGLSFFKLGEEAFVPLDKFTLDGAEAKEFRHNQNRLFKEGITFEIIPKDKAPQFFDDFGTISDAWLAKKNTQEKSFSLGCFDPDYLKYFSYGVVKNNQGKIIAFTNILKGANKQELTNDLVRYHPVNAPKGVMTFLTVQILLWGKQQGYKYFTFGMAPLSGFENRPFAPLWNKIGAFIFNRGEYFYNFEGLREYKEKFHPIWKPKYLASPGGLILPEVLTAVAALNSGGLKGIFIK